MAERNGVKSAKASLEDAFVVRGGQFGQDAAPIAIGPVCSGIVQNVVDDRSLN